MTTLTVTFSKELTDEQIQNIVEAFNYKSDVKIVKFEAIQEEVYVHSGGSMDEGDE
jgi:F0F1-type ATP synthase delta subunit